MIMYHSVTIHTTYLQSLLCTKCKPGYGLPLYSNSWKCEKCNDKHSLVYLLLELLPPTVFYLLVIIFDINATAPPFTAFVFLCNLFSLFFRENVAFRVIAQRYTTKMFLQFVSALISIQNLDLFRYVIPPLCQQPLTGHSFCTARVYVH